MVTNDTVFDMRGRGGSRVKSNKGDRCEGTWVTLSQSGIVNVIIFLF